MLKLHFERMRCGYLYLRIREQVKSQRITGGCKREGAGNSTQLIQKYFKKKSIIKTDNPDRNVQKSK